LNASLDRANYKVTFGVLVLGVSAYALLQSLVIPALTTIQATMHTSQNTVTWVVTAYLLSASIFTPVMGRVGDILGKEHMMVATLVALSLGSVIAGLATNVTVLIIGRAVQGIGGGVIPLAFGIIRDEFPREKLASAIGTIAAMTAVGGGVGLIVAGPILQGLGLHWLFWIPFIMTTIAAVLTYFLVPESPERSPGRISISAALLLSAWLVALLLAVSEAPTWGWFATKTLTLGALGLVLLITWVVVELKVNDPVVDMKMMRIPAVWTNNLVAFLFGIGMYSIFAFLPEFVQTPRAVGYGFTEHHGVGTLLDTPLRGHVLRRPLLGQDRRTLRFQGRGRCRLGHLGRGLRGTCPGALRVLGDLPGEFAARYRSGARVLGHVEPHRPRGPGESDRGGQWHERQHSHHRRCGRRGHHVQHRDVQDVGFGCAV